MEFTVDNSTQSPYWLYRTKLPLVQDVWQAMKVSSDVRASIAVSPLSMKLSIAMLLPVVYLLHSFICSGFKDTDGLPLVNRRSSWEPQIFASFRWAFKSLEIMRDAQKKVC